MATGPDGIRAGPVTPAEFVAPLGASGDVRQEVFHRSLQQMLGQQMQGNVLSRLADGSFLVNVNGAAARMQLPEGTKAGDSLPMTLASLNPRPTFVLSQEHGNATVVLLQDPAAEELTYARQPAPGPAALRTAAGATPENARAAAQPTGDAGARAALLAASGQLEEDGLTYGPRLPAAAQAAAAPAQSGAATAASAAAVLARATLATPMLPSLPDDGSSAQAQLSDTGRLIAQVLQAAQNDELAAVILGKTPLVGSPDAAPAQIAAALHDTLSQSGVFYESHLRQWVDGKMTLAELAREPQAAGPRTADASATAASAQTGQAAQAALAGAAGAQSNATEPALAFPQLVNLQLNTLEQNSLQWAGQIWPGQQMQWEVRQQVQSRQGGQGASADEDETRSWQSSMRFRFPLLGQVEATIHLSGGAVRVELHTREAASATLLREGAAALGNALDAAGSPMQSFVVKHDGAAG